MIQHGTLVMQHGSLLAFVARLCILHAMLHIPNSATLRRNDMPCTCQASGLHGMMSTQHS